MNKGTMFLPQQAAEFGSFGHVVMTLESRIRKRGLQNLSLWLRKAMETRSVSGVSRLGGPERTLYKAIKVKPGLCWRPQDAGDRNHRISAKESCRPGVEPDQERKVCCNQQSWKELELQECFDNRHKDAVWSLPRWFYILLFIYLLYIFPHYAPLSPPPCGTLMYSLWHCMLEVCDPFFLFDFDFTRVTVKITVLSLRRDFELCFKQHWDCGRLWRLLKLDWMIFALCYGYKPMWATEWAVLVLNENSPYRIIDLVTREWD